MVKAKISISRTKDAQKWWWFKLYGARHKMFPYVLECYGAGKSVTPNNDCKTLTIFCFRGKSPNLSQRVLDDIFQQSTVQKLLDLLVFVADPPFFWSLQMVWVSFSPPKLEGTWFHLSRSPSKVKRNIGRQNPMELVLKAKTSTFFGPVVAMPCPGDGQVTVVRGLNGWRFTLQGTNIFDLGRRKILCQKCRAGFLGYVIVPRRIHFFGGMGESSSN